MPSSSPADQLAKRLHPFLTAAISPAVLKSLGWFDFLTSDRPDTTDAVEMATNAFIYLSLEEDGSWNRQKAILSGIIAFLKTRVNKSPSPGDLLDLKSLLDRPPISNQAIRQWFDRVYR